MTCPSTVTKSTHNLGSQVQHVVPHGGDIKAAAMWGSWSRYMDSLLLHSFWDPIHGMGLPTFKEGTFTSLSAVGSQQTLPETSQLWLETVLLWIENVSHPYKDFHSICHHDLIPENKALSDLLPDFFSNCANNVTRVHKHSFCSPTTLPGLPSLSTTTSFLVHSPDSWLQALENKDLYYLCTENSPCVSIKFMYLCIVRC